MSNERIAILGLGKAGGSLLASLRKARVTIVAKGARLTALKKTRAWHTATVLVLAVPDNAIADVARAIAAEPAVPGLVVHLSGARGASALSSLEARGVTVGTFHPLASLDGKATIPRGTFVAVEAAARAPGVAQDGEKRLVRLAKKLGLVAGTVRDADRVRYHAGAVIAGNLATALLHEGIELLVRSGVNRDVARVSLARLLASTAQNAIAHPLAAALTGPVARGDIATVEGHLALLDREDQDLAVVYRVLSAVLVDDVSAHAAPVRQRLRDALK